MSDTAADWCDEHALPRAQCACAADSLRPRVRRYSELKLPPAATWLGVGWIPLRELTVVVGEEGIGKSMSWVLIAAHVTTGTAFAPFKIPAREPADVLLIITEDSAAEVAARLELAGADMSRILWYSIDEDGTGSPVFGSDLTGDFAKLDEYLAGADQRPALVVVDAWLDTVASGLNVRDTQQARAALHPWKTLASRHDFAALLVTHTNRLDTTSTRDMMGGTGALRQKARMVLFAARPKDAEEPVLFIGPDKSNTTGLVNAVRFHVQAEQVREQTDDDPGTAARLARANYTTATIRDHISEWKQRELEANRAPTKAEEAQQVVLDFMAGRTEAPARELKEHLRGAGFGQRAAEDAIKACGESRPGEARGPWMFSLFQTSQSVPMSVESADIANSADIDPVLTSQSPQSSQSPHTWQGTADIESESVEQNIWGVNPSDQRRAS